MGEVEFIGNVPEAMKKKAQKIAEALERQTPKQVISLTPQNDKPKENK